MINLFFGNVVDVQDDERIQRVRATIKGYTDEIEVNDLPWYYPFFGVHFLPIVGDVVPIFIFNGNFTTGFYNKKVDWTSVGLEGTEYENYVEIYKRAGVELSYKESVGIQLINANSRLQIETDRASMYVEDNQITMTKDRIDLGVNGPAMPLGDKTVEAFTKQLNLSKALFDQYIQLFDVIKNAANGPILKPIKIALTAAVPIAKSAQEPKFPPNQNYIDQIQSKKVFIE